MISNTVVLHLSKGEFAKSIPSKATRRSFMQSAINLTDMRGVALRRWLRRVVLFNSVGV